MSSGWATRLQSSPTPCVKVALTLDADARLEVLDPQKVPLGTSSIQPTPPPRRGAEPGEPAQTVSRQPRFDAGHLIAGLEGGRPGDGLGKVITVFSTKGGAGTSMLATSLAVSLTQRSSGPVCLIDADLQFGDAAVMLKLTPRHTIVGAVAALDRIDPNFLGQLLMTHEPSGCACLPPLWRTCVCGSDWGVRHGADRRDAPNLLLGGGDRHPRLLQRRGAESGGDLR
ncbi:MAG: P-loop NTPase [Candidatus Microthrix sp.]|nr:P-loop NTPase [Candidatus Microthrix sp.]